VKLWEAGVRTEAVQGDAGVVDHKIDSLRVRLFQVLREGLDASLVCDVELVILYLRKPTVSLQRFGLLQLRVLLELLQRGLTPALVAGCEVDKKRPIVEGRFGVLKSNLADDCETDALGMLVECVGECNEQTHLVCAGDDADSAVRHDFWIVVMLLMDEKDDYLPLLRSKVPHALAVCSLIIIEAVGRS
jgi:hypothetical protein